MTQESSIWDDVMSKLLSCSFQSQEDEPTAVKYTNKFGEEAVQKLQAQCSDSSEGTCHH